MKREELTPIELECNMGPDVNGVVHREPWKAYDIDEVNLLLDDKDAEIASLKAENEQLKAKLESTQASAYADSVDAGMRERRLRRALYKACANWAKSFKTTAEMLGAHVDAVKWDNMEHKCLKKAEGYK